jgi:hypothetical protein
VGIVPPLRPGSLAGRPIALAIIVLIRSLGSPGVTSSFLRHSTALHLCGRSDTLVPQAPRSRPAGACATATLVHRGQNQGSSDRFAAGRLPHYLYFRLDCLERRHLIYARGLSPSALPPTTRVWSPSAVCHDSMILDDFLMITYYLRPVLSAGIRAVEGASRQPKHLPHRPSHSYQLQGACPVRMDHDRELA